MGESSAGLRSIGEVLDAIFDFLGLEGRDRANGEDVILETVELDSLQAVELLIVLESLAGSDVPSAHVPDLYTWADVYQYYLILRHGD